MKNIRPMPEALAEFASLLTPHEQEQLWRAAIVMADSRGAVMRLTALFGRRIESLRERMMKTGQRFGGAAWGELTARVQDAVEDTLWSSYDLATFGLMAMPRVARSREARNNGAHRMLTAASGVASGFIGLPGVLFDIPLTTTTILRSIAEIARDNGEDVDAEETKRACLEVLAFGGPSSVDDETEIGYWGARIGMNHFALNLLIKSAAGRFGLIISDKILAQAVPVLGAATGGALNYAFTEYYQKMAQVHFCLRALDRRTGEPAAVRSCFTEMVKAARDRRRIIRSKPEGRATTYLPR
jgi:hypothetical protein